MLSEVRFNINISILIIITYYINTTGCEKDFIELLEIISVNGLDKIIQAIDKLKSISTGIVNTDKIKSLVQRNDAKVVSLLSKKEDQIEAYFKRHTCKLR